MYMNVNYLSNDTLCIGALKLFAACSTPVVVHIPTVRTASSHSNTLCATVTTYNPPATQPHWEKMGVNRSHQTTSDARESCRRLRYLLNKTCEQLHVQQHFVCSRYMITTKLFTRVHNVFCEQSHMHAYSAGISLKLGGFTSPTSEMIAVRLCLHPASNLESCAYTSDLLCLEEQL